MNYGRIAIAAVAATVVYYTYGFLVEGLLIRKDFSPCSAVYRSAETMPGYIPLGFACNPDCDFRDCRDIRERLRRRIRRSARRPAWCASRYLRGVYVRRGQLCCPYQKLHRPTNSEIDRAPCPHVSDQTSSGDCPSTKTKLRIVNEHTARSAFSREHLEIFLDQ